MARTQRSGRHTVVVVLVAVAVAGAAACQSSPTAPSRGAAPLALAPGVGGASGWNAAGMDVGPCFSTSTPACFNAAALDAGGVAAAPVTGPPINLAAAVSGANVRLTWTPPALQDAPVISYIIDVGSSAGFVIADLLSVDTVDSSTALDASAVPPGTYYVRVRARNALGVSAASNEVQVIVGVVIAPPAGCPGAPRSLAGTAAAGVVNLTWLPPLSGTAQSYILEAGSAPGAANLAAFDNGPATTFARAGVPAGVYYLRIRAVAAGCAPSAASNELALTMPGAAGGGGNPLVTLTLAYTCGACTGDPDNYALNVDCVNGRCTVFRTANASRSGTITAPVRMAPGVHNVEIVVRNRLNPWVLTVTATPPGSGGMVPGSWRILDPPGGSGVSPAACAMTGVAVEAFVQFTVTGAGSPSC